MRVTNADIPEMFKMRRGKEMMGMYLVHLEPKLTNASSSSLIGREGDPLPVAASHQEFGTKEGRKDEKMEGRKEEGPHKDALSSPPPPRPRPPGVLE